MSCRERFSTVGLFEDDVYPGISKLLYALTESGTWLVFAITS